MTPISLKLARIACLLIFPVLCGIPAHALLAQDSPGMQERPPVTSLHEEMLFSKVIVMRYNQDPISGFLMDVRGDSLYVQTKGKVQSVSFSSVLKITVLDRPVAGRAAAYGALLGMYLGNVLFWTSDIRPGYYVDAPSDNQVSGIIASNLAFALIGGGLAYLFASASDDEQATFMFGGDDRKRALEIEQFKQYSRGDGGRHGLHVTLQSSRVNPVSGNKAAEILQGNGIPTAGSTVPYYYYSFYNSVQRSSVNFVRKIQVTYSPKPSYALGLAYMGLSEPAYPEGSGGSVGDLTYSLKVSTALNGWYAVGTFQPFAEGLEAPFEWQLGAGLGIANYDCALEGRRIVGTGSETFVANESRTGNNFSAVLYTDFNIYLYSSLSLGFNIEYVYVSEFSAPALEGVTTNGVPLSYSSTSWGIVIGMHF